MVVFIFLYDKHVKIENSYVVVKICRNLNILGFNKYVYLLNQHENKYVVSGPNSHGPHRKSTHSLYFTSMFACQI